jgi:hypothetical protein
METPNQPAPVPGPPQQPPEPPEMPKYLTRRSAVVMAIGFGVLALIALSRFGGDSATISARSVGPLEIGKASKKQMQYWAKGPVRFWINQRGTPPFHYKGELHRYQCVGQSEIFGKKCRTFYGIVNGRVATFESNSPQFRTAAKTRIGSSIPEARKSEHAVWSGWQVKCPHLSLPAPKGTVFFASVSRNEANPKGYVSGFYLSATPSSFAYCSARIG